MSQPIPVPTQVRVCATLTREEGSREKNTVTRPNTRIYHLILRMVMIGTFAHVEAL